MRARGLIAAPVVAALAGWLVVLTARGPAGAGEPGGAVAPDLTTWEKQPAAAAGEKASVTAGTADLRGGAAPGRLWNGLLAPGAYRDVELSAAVTLREASRREDFFGASWSAWPPRDWADGGYDAALLLRAGPDGGYRVQLSHRYQDVALVKYPEGGYLRVVPCPVRLDRPHTLAAAVRGDELTVRLDGRELIRCRDAFLPLGKGRVGVGAGGGARATFDKVALRELPAAPAAAPPPAHAPRFSARKWLGGRTWVFDGDQPVLQLHNARDPSCFARLKPGYKPQLTFDSHWGLENQGAYKEASSTWTEPAVAGGGKTLRASWSARHTGNRFATRSTLTVGYDAARDSYTYDVDSELEVLPGGPFHFRYGYDFEHHTPLDPFRWQYLVVRGREGRLFHRPVYPIDPGPMEDLYPRGLRLWYGRHGEKMHVAPAVEYAIEDAGARKLHSAVCAAFYDTGIAFGAETAAAGTRVKVRYRYTGYPAAEAAALFEQSAVYPSRMLDPEHYYLFADEWPKLTFSKFEPMSKSWVLGRRPFLTAHNARPTYELARGTGVGSGFAMRLGPASYGRAELPLPGPLAAGRYAVRALVKSDGAVGPGGRVELTATQARTDRVLLRATHYLGNGSFGWKRAGFAFELPAEAAGLALGLGNAGTGEVLVAEVEFRKLAEGEALPEGVTARADAVPPRFGPAPAGALADYRMTEQKGLFVFDHAGGPLGHLELANVGWATDEGRPALRFADNPAGRAVYPRGRNLDVSYLGHPAYKDARGVPAAIAGTHGGSLELKGVTLAAWVKPAAAMGRGGHGGFGDVAGFGARRFVLRLAGARAPYRLAASLSNADFLESKAELTAGRWHHVALTAEPAAADRWRVRLYLDGRRVHEALSQKVTASPAAPPSLILGAELFYLHDAYYRGLIGRTLVFGRALTAEEVAGLARDPSP